MLRSPSCRELSCHHGSCSTSHFIQQNFCLKGLIKPPDWVGRRVWLKMPRNLSKAKPWGIIAFFSPSHFSTTCKLFVRDRIQIFSRSPFKRNTVVYKLLPSFLSHGSTGVSSTSVPDVLQVLPASLIWSGWGLQIRIVSRYLVLPDCERRGKKDFSSSLGNIQVGKEPSYESELQTLIFACGWKLGASLSDRNPS